MKRYGNLYHKICDTDSIRLAHKNASKGKKHYSEVKKFNEDKDYYIEKIQAMLEDKTFVNSEYEVFTTNAKGKEREIYKLPYFPDRVIHHAIVQVLEPIWKSTLIADTYQSIRGRGVHKAKKKIEYAIRKHTPKYCLKLDIKKFYPSINNSMLKGVVRKKVKCNDTLWLLDEVIDSTEGVPIGNYMSQYLGNLYLTYFDHWVKEEMGVTWYCRYCDDMVILGNNKKELHTLLDAIRTKVGVLGFTVKGDHRVFPIAVIGIDFLGFRFFPTYTLLRKKIKKNCAKALKMLGIAYKTRCRSSVIGIVGSYSGWSRHSDGCNLWVGLAAEVKLKKVYSILRIPNKVLIR